MHIEINAADGVERSEALDRHIRERLERVSRHQGDRLTQIIVHLKDTNAGKGGVDKLCSMEARPAGLDPITVHAQDTDMYLAVRDAADKLDRAIEHRLGRQESRG
jgi:ribosomal subunit interface protein